jgi:nicotinamide-nucleotide amidase
MTGPAWVPHRAVIIAVGSELLTPNKTDTNSLWLTGRLNELGITVVFKIVVGDDGAALAGTLRHAMTDADLVVTTGGLGPTDDDLTRDTVAAVLDRRLSEDPNVTAWIRARFDARELRMPEINRRQAMVPDGAEVLENSRGTAPGLWIEHPDGVVVLLPGPPRELKPMFSALAEGRLAGATGGRRIFRRTIHIAGRTESHVEEIAQPIYSRWRPPAPCIETSVLATLGQIELHLATQSADAAEAAQRLDDAVAALTEALGPDVVSIDERDLEEVVGDLLRAAGRRVALAESCTGGLVASRLTDVPGSSAYVQAGWVAYTDASKVEALGVPADLIERHGAVSEPVAAAMAEGARVRGHADYAIGVSGIAGPGGGNDEKPVGTVWLALSGPAGTRTRRLQLPGGRLQIKFQSSQAALDMLRRSLLRDAGRR